jgi:indole-3-glycerol phosphate synthase
MADTILDKILATKKREVERHKQAIKLSCLLDCIARRQAPLVFARALKGDDIRLIAEVKKASPSRGVMRPYFDPMELAKTYAENGAAAISVLTDAEYFQGSPEHLAAIRHAVELPLLRKDFIYDEYQIYESAAYGADALLLIAAILKPKQLKQLLTLSRSLGLGCLVEVHNEDELSIVLDSDAETIGINNRDLKTFKVDLNTTRRLCPLIPEGKIVVSESGINNRDDVQKLREWGVNAMLIGEALITARDIPARIKELMS